VHGVTDRRRAPTGEETTARDMRIIEEYRGWAPWEVATWEDCDPESVKRLRREHILDPHDGTPDRNLSDRDKRIVKMVKAGVSSRTIAAEFAISHAQVQRIASAA
jgi:ATP/maltotriose-dependent transcriptional regulator MalT